MLKSKLGLVLGTRRLSTTGTSEYRYVIVGALALATLINFLVLFNLGVLLPSISEDLGLSPSQQGWLGSSAIIANLVMALPLGWLLSKIDAKWVVTLTLMLGGLFIFVQGWAPVFAVLLIGRVVFGLSGIAREPARAMLTQQWVPQKEIVVVNGLLNATIGVAIAVGFFLTPFILEWTDNDWRTALYIFGAVTIVIGFIWHFLGRERVTPEYRERSLSQHETPLRTLLKYPELWAVGFGLFGANLLWMAMITFWPTLMLNEFDISLVSSGTMMGLNGVASSISGILFAWMMVKVDVGRWILGACGILISGTALGMVIIGDVAPLFILSFLNGIGWGFFTVVMTIPFQLPEVKPREIAIVVAFFETLLWAGGAVGPALAGLLQEATGNLQLTLASISFTGLFLTLGALLIPSRARRQAIRVVKERVV